ncbi:MAG: HEAT repeat domain-containing protein [Pirellulales bacterium]
MPPAKDDGDMIPWARQFLAELAAGKHEDLVSLEDFTNQQHAVLREIVPHGFTSRSAKERAAAIWIAGEVNCPTPAVHQIVARAFRDRSERVRRAAAWAVGKRPEQSDLFAPLLASAIEDRDKTVRFGAMTSADILGPLCRVCIPSLLRLAQSENLVERSAAVSALASVGPDDPEVRNRLFELLDDQDELVRRAVARGIGESRTSNPAAVRRLAGMLQDADRDVRYFATVALSKLAVSENAAVAPLLRLMASEEWYEVRPFSGEPLARINVREELVAALDVSLGTIDDVTLDDFRRQFYDFAFREDRTNTGALAEGLAAHDFYQKVQRAKLGKPRNQADRELFDELMRQAQEKFAQRLLSNPTLNLSPEDAQKLPRWILWVSRSIASNLWRGLKRARKRAQRATPMAFALSPVAGVETAEIVQKLFGENCAALSEEELLVAKLAYLQGETNASIIKSTQLSASQVKTRKAAAFKKIAAWARTHV